MVNDYNISDESEKYEPKTFIREGAIRTRGLNMHIDKCRGCGMLLIDDEKIICEECK